MLGVAMLGVVDEMETLRQLLEVKATLKVVAMLVVVEEMETLRQLLEVTEALPRIDDEPRLRSVFNYLQPIILLWEDKGSSCVGYWRGRKREGKRPVNGGRVL
ncbi:hypothetical protein Q3G72_015782 [Acer saccharum]|nr:hypothetical protein Q3G72_015782 [Acer saccharum]